MNMDIMLLNDVSQKIRNNPECLKEKEQAVCDLIAELMELGCTAREKGLLELEDIAQEKSKTGKFTDKVMSRMLFLIVNGTDPEDVTEIMITQYMFNHYNSPDSLMFYLVYRGLLLLQAGENPDIMMLKLKACVPAACTGEEFRTMVMSLHKKRILRWKPDEMLLD